VLPGFARPGVVAWLTGTGNGVGLPHLLAGIRVDRLDPAAHAVFGAGRAEDDLAAQRHWHNGEGLGVGVVTHLLVPHHLAGLAVERDDMSVQGREVNLVLVHGHTAVHHIAAQLREYIARQLALVLPFHRTRDTISSDHAVERRRHVHRAVDHHGLAVLTLQHAERQVPHGTQALHVVP